MTTITVTNYQPILNAIAQKCWDLAQECYDEAEKLSSMMDQQATRRCRKSMRPKVMANRYHLLLDAASECRAVANAASTKGIRKVPVLLAEKILARQPSAFLEKLGTYHVLYTGKIGAIYAKNARPAR